MFKYSMMMLLAAAPVASRAAVPEPTVSDADIKVRAPTLPVITDGPELLASFGGRAGLVSIMDDAMARWLANPRTRPFFADANQAHIKALLVEQFCVVMNGPCSYSGRTMAEAHRGMGVKEGDFYALVEELQVVLNAHKVPFPAQNRLIAALAPMHRDIIDK